MKKHVGYADGKRLILNRKQGKKFNLGGGVNDFKNNAIAKLKQWKNEKLEDINYSAKILGITNINPSYIKAFNKLNDLVEDCTKIIKSGILKDGEFTYWKTFNVKTYVCARDTEILGCGKAKDGKEYKLPIIYCVFRSYSKRIRNNLPSM